MSFNYPSTAATATRLLERFGASATLKHPTGSAYDPDTGTTVPTYASTATTAAVFDFDQKYIDGTLIRQGDKRAYMAPAAAPVQGDRLTWDGTDFEIVAVKPISPAGTPVLFEAQVRA